MTEQERTTRRHLVGRKVFSVGHLTETESRQLGFSSRPLCITFDDNTMLIVPPDVSGQVQVRRARNALVVLRGLAYETEVVVA